MKVTKSMMIFIIIKLACATEGVCTDKTDVYIDIGEEVHASEPIQKKSKCFGCVKYGAGSHYITKATNGEFVCGNDYFGQDPLPGWYKTCQCSHQCLPPSVGPNGKCTCPAMDPGLCKVTKGVFDCICESTYKGVFTGLISVSGVLGLFLLILLGLVLAYRNRARRVFELSQQLEERDLEEPLIQSPTSSPSSCSSDSSGYKKIPDFVTTEFFDMANRLGREHECSICLDNIIGVGSVITRCGHKFHQRCLSEWAKGEYRQCPECRKSLRKK